MSDYWQPILQRNQDTCGVWGTHAPAFTVGELTPGDTEFTLTAGNADAESAPTAPVLLTVA